MDFSIFATPEAWISLITLIFLEIVLGVDNLVFISITTNRLPENERHIGRKLGLAGALVMRIIFLCFASWLVHLSTPLFTIDIGFYSHGYSVRDLVMLVGGAYLIYKGIIELRDMLRLTEVKAEHSEEHKSLHLITLPQAVGTIMVMDVVFSIDSVITAVGLAQHLIIMILAVIIAVIFMMIFIDAVSTFINGHPEMKILALVFIAAIGVLLVLDSCGLHTDIELLDMHVEKLMVYFAMIFSIILELIQMRYNGNLKRWYASLRAEGKLSDSDLIEKLIADENATPEGLEEQAQLKIEAEADSAAADVAEIRGNHVARKESATGKSAAGMKQTASHKGNGNTSAADDRKALKEADKRVNDDAYREEDDSASDLSGSRVEGILGDKRDI